MPHHTIQIQSRREMNTTKSKTSNQKRNFKQKYCEQNFNDGWIYKNRFFFFWKKISWFRLHPCRVNQELQGFLVTKNPQKKISTKSGKNLKSVTYVTAWRWRWVHLPSHHSLPWHHLQDSRAAPHWCNLRSGKERDTISYWPNTFLLIQAQKHFHFLDWSSVWSNEAKI